MIIYLNGQYVKEEEARLSPFDHGFLYGIGVFETFRLYEGEPFLLDWHMDRLNNALEQLRIELELTKSEVLAILDRLLQLNQPPNLNAKVRLNISAGPGDSGLFPDSYKKPGVMVMMNPFHPESIPVEKEGVILQVRRNTPEGPFRLKSHHFLNNLFGKRELGPDAAKEGIFLTEGGAVAEGIISNIFWEKDGCVYTPSLDTGILGGVTRRYVIERLADMGIEVMQGVYPLKELLFADEAWMTNSVQEIVPFRRIGSTQFPGKDGNLSKRLQEAYTNDRKAAKDYISIKG
ncbi:MAG: aminodeoxychorismate lyase [Bacillus sp. (in: Bacteria)]|uniref:aminodeoxychorismate lyase n=1 Tax=Bacillus paralicheniformis TaxID=1648923 RepID=A0A6I7TXK6_9BACI|nr:MULTISPECIES: aminodeoxychorismate lyase [Bacillus]KUL15438.1 4-amino-4-deoxychorismate lyase [Bacillus licheniformis LMG 6934]MBC8625112.1 aminodeoxychorismate lyase [Robertmurraya crescens]POO76813.1 4-amino-4-deoxychorismate lyase [Bacillus sp. MBGLi97]ARA84062.1 4-amino-4-deoxychorismate lyase [Bacillus paralicheniformis]MBG9882673.1 4-amino-4-deoxychorismate lyase [Bacillus paralicheniformis]